MKVKIFRFIESKNLYENKIRLCNYDLEKLNNELIHINKELESIEEEK